MKKDVSDHLSRVFFDAPPKKKKNRGLFYFLALTSGFAVTFALGSIFLSRPRHCLLDAPGRGIRFQKHDGPHTLIFDFSGDAPKRVSLDIDLPALGLSQFRGLSFKARFAECDFRKSGVLKVGLFNMRREGGYAYVADVGGAWKKFFLPVSSFDKIPSEVSPLQLIFMIEEWNISPQKGKLLVDDLEFLAK